LSEWNFSGMKRIKQYGQGIKAFDFEEPGCGDGPRIGGFGRRPKGTGRGQIAHQRPFITLFKQAELSKGMGAPS
jgi:hypothetical protein